MSGIVEEVMIGDCRLIGCAYPRQSDTSMRCVAKVKWGNLTSL